MVHYIAAPAELSNLVIISAIFIKIYAYSSIIEYAMIIALIEFQGMSQHVST